MTWEEIIQLLKAYNNAVETGNEEDIAHICNILPDEIRFWDDEIHIVLNPT